MIDSNREEFEKLPEIARMVACDEIKWCDTYHWYRTDNTDANSIYHVAWLNGAWYAFQEQQKKLDCCREENKAYLEKIDELQARVDGLKRTQNNLELKAEDAECVSMSLDDQSVAKCDGDGNPYSLWGRVCQFKETSNVTEGDLERIYWEFDQERNNSGGERVVFKNTLRSLLNNLKGNKDEN